VSLASALTEDEQHATVPVSGPSDPTVLEAATNGH